MKLLSTIPLLFTLATTALGQFGGFGGGGFGGGGFGGGGFGGGGFGGFGGDAGAGGAGGAASVPALKEGPPATTDTIKIMPMGDSITFGMGENGGYRKYLYSALTQKGYKIDMVGPEGSASASAAGITYDDNHAGYSGFQIKQVPDWARQQGQTGNLYDQLKQKNAVKQAQPDIVLLIIGTNDMTANRSMDACATDLRALIDYILADLPADSIIFMGSIPEFTAYGGNPQRVADYNNTVKKVAEEYESKGKNVRFADVHSSLNGSNDLGGDQLHPNGNGYKKMGAFWAQVVDDYLQSKYGSSTPAVTEQPPAVTEQPPAVTEQPPAVNQPVTPPVTQPVTPPTSNLSECSAKITSQGYKCCSKNCVVYYTDADGTWGVENNQWCGCGNASSAACVGAQGYPCCTSTTAVAFVDSDGNWGVENGNWCIIRA